MRLKYSIEEIKQVSENEFFVRYSVWTGCACNKVKREGTVISYRIPSLSHIMELEKTMPEYKIPGSKL